MLLYSLQGEQPGRFLPSSVRCSWLTFYSPYSFASPVFTGFAVCFVVYESIIAGRSYMDGYVKIF